MLFTRKCCLFILLAACCAGTFLQAHAASLPADAGDYLRVNRGKIQVYYLPGDSLVAEENLGWAEAYRARPAYLAGRRLTGLSIYVAPTLEEFARLSGGMLPEWGVACAIAGTDVVIVRSPRVRGLWREDPHEVLYHEITHVFLDQMMDGARVPRWFHEGYAQYVSQMWDLDSFLDFSVAILAGKVFRLRDLEYGFPADENRARLAYLQSYTVVEFMFRRWNEQQMKLLLRRWKQLGSLDPALRGSLGLTLDQMEQLWLEWAGVRYGWLKLLTSATLMWIAASFLFVFIYIVRRRRYKIKLRAMQLREARLAQSITPVVPYWESDGEEDGDEPSGEPDGKNQV